MGASLWLALAGPALAVGLPAPPQAPMVPSAPERVSEEGISLTQLSYERLLEDSLRQALAAYLGADQFVLQVRAAFAAPGGFSAPGLPEDSGYDDAPPLPGLPGIGANDVVRREVRVQVRQGGAPRLERLRISLVLPSTLKPGEEDFLKNLVFQKADLNFARGDTLDLSRREFPRAAALPPVVPGTPPGVLTATPALAPGNLAPVPGGMPVEPVTSLPGWAWGLMGAFGTATLVFGGLLLRRRPETPAPQPPMALMPVPAESSKAAEALLASLDAQKAQEPLPVRHDLTMLLLDHPEGGARHLRRVLGEEGGLEKAARLVKGLGTPLARRLVPGLADTEWKAIELMLLEQGEIKREDQREAMAEAFYAIMRSRTEAPREDKLSPFAFLTTLDDSQLLFLLEEESTRIQALVLSQLPPDRAIGLMRLKPPAEQGAIAAAMGELHLLPMSAFHDVAKHLAQKAAEAPSFETAVTNGLGLLVNLLDHSDRITEQGILSGLSSQNPKLFAQVRETYLTFEDLARVPREVLKDALREADKETLAEALRDAPVPVKDAIVSSLTDRARRIVEETLEGPAVVALEEARVDAIRKDLVGRVRQLMQAGRFSMKDLAPVAQEDA